VLHVALHAEQLARPVQRIYRLPDALDTVALLAAYRRTVASNEALRLRLSCADGVWHQQFTAWIPTIEGINVHGGTPDQRQAFALNALLSQSAEAFDLTKDPPIAAGITKVDDRFFFALTVDHLAADDLAFDQIEGELTQHYQALVADSDAEPAISTGGFSAYLGREQARSATRDGSLDFWTGMLCGAPLSASDMSLHWVDGISIQFVLDREATNRLLGQCRKLACSPFIALLAAQALLLCRLGGGHDLVINVPFSNRATAADQLVVGNLSMLAHLRIQLDPVERTGDFIRRLRDLVLKAMKHRNYDYPVLSDILARDAQERGGVAHRMLGCSYLVEREPGEGHLLDRITPPALLNPQTPNGSFALACRHRRQEMEISVVWDPRQWPITGDRLPDAFRELLDAIATPDTIVRDLIAPPCR
jgi:hypothetical protein